MNERFDLSVLLYGYLNCWFFHSSLVQYSTMSAGQSGVAMGDLFRFPAFGFGCWHSVFTICGSIWYFPA